MARKLGLIDLLIFCLINKFDKNLVSCGMWPNADCMITNIVGQNGYCLCFTDHFLMGQKVNNNESVLKILFHIFSNKN